MYHSSELIDIFLKVVEIFDGLKIELFGYFQSIRDWVPVALLGNITTEYVRVLTFIAKQHNTRIQNHHTKNEHG
jgi:hypothetical protein